MIINESTRLNEGIQIVTIDEDKLMKQMRKYHYDSDSYLMFIEDKYGFKDGKDYQLGNDGLTFTFYQNTRKNDTEKFKKELM